MAADNPLLYSDWRAMILAAGFGTRLKPLTEHRPKPLIEVAGVPMINLALNRLRQLKPWTLVVNGHHLSAQLEDYLEREKRGFRDLEYIFEPEILDTGGGIANAAKFLAGPFLVTHNADIVSDIPLRLAVVRHLQSRALVTMIMHDKAGYNQVEVDPGGVIRGFGIKRPASGNRLLAYTGIQIGSPLLLDLLAREPVAAFSLITFYRRLLAVGRVDIRAHIVDTGEHYYWRDLGTHDDLAEFEHDLQQNPSMAPRLGIIT